MSAVVQHALREEPTLGETGGAPSTPLGPRISRPGRRSSSECSKALRTGCRRKDSRRRHAETESLPHLIKGPRRDNRFPAVRTLLEEIISKYPTQDLAAEATKALEGFRTVSQRNRAGGAGTLGRHRAVRPSESLPESSSDSRVTGTLTPVMSAAFLAERSVQVKEILDGQYNAPQGGGRPQLRGEGPGHLSPRDSGRDSKAEQLDVCRESRRHLLGSL